MDFSALNPLRWKKSILIGILVAALSSWLLFFDTFSLLNRVELHQREKELLGEIERLQSEILLLEAELEELNSDPATLERIAREEYGMRKPGETVYRITRPESSSSRSGRTTRRSGE